MEETDALKWTRRFMSIAEHIATWSRDPSTKVGAVIVGCGAASKKVIGMGFNGFPRGVDDLPGRYDHRPTKYAMIVHSEANAILDARGHDTTGGCLITTKFPCSSCAKLIIQAGLLSVISPSVDPTNAGDQRWMEDYQISLLMFMEAGLSAYALTESGLVAHNFEAAKI